MTSWMLKEWPPQAGPDECFAMGTFPEVRRPYPVRCIICDELCERSEDRTCGKCREDASTCQRCGSLAAIDAEDLQICSACSFQIYLIAALPGKLVHHMWDAGDVKRRVKTDSHTDDPPWWPTLDGTFA